MLKKMTMLCLGLGFALQAQAFDRNQVNYNDFWGTWSIYNTKTSCSDVFTFTKPANFSYTSKQKKMSGKFSIVSSNNNQLHDLLIIKVKNDNRLLGCNNQNLDFSNKNINYVLKWIGPKTAEICSDREAKKCTGAFLMKQ